MGVSVTEHTQYDEVTLKPHGLGIPDADVGTYLCILALHFTILARESDESNVVLPLATLMPNVEGGV